MTNILNGNIQVRIEPCKQHGGVYLSLIQTMHQTGTSDSQNPHPNGLDRLMGGWNIYIYIFFEYEAIKLVGLGVAPCRSIYSPVPSPNGTHSGLHSWLTPQVHARTFPYFKRVDLVIGALVLLVSEKIVGPI